MEKNSIDRKNSPSGINSAKSFLVFSLAVCLLFLMTKSLSAGVADSTQGRQLFNGKDLTGWKQAGPGSHYVEDGFIKSKGGMGLLYWLSLIHISEPTRLGMISYAVFCL